MSPIADFSYAANELSAFSFSINTFIISLKDEEVIKYTCSDPSEFRRWLEENNIRNVNYSAAKVVAEEKKYQMSLEWLGHLLTMIVLPVRDLIKDVFPKMLQPRID